MLRLLMDGRPNKVIAQAMGITIGTVKQHQHNVHHKLHIRGRAALAVWAVTHPVELG
jgi:DNA-binding CsgD family transcriptional regulator